MDEHRSGIPGRGLRGFLEKGGFKFMLETFMSYEVDSDSFKLHYASFMLKLLKFFVVLLISS